MPRLGRLCGFREHLTWGGGSHRRKGGNLGCDVGWRTARQHFLINPTQGWPVPHGGIPVAGVTQRPPTRILRGSQPNDLAADAAAALLHLHLGRAVFLGPNAGWVGGGGIRGHTRCHKDGGQGSKCRGECAMLLKSTSLASYLKANRCVALARCCKAG